jgi:hypothetical protein
LAREIDVTPSTRLLQVLGDIPLQPWQCLAELVDNSLDELSRGSRYTNDAPLRIDIDLNEISPGKHQLVIKDNGCGMSEAELAIALRAGATSKSRYGTLGLFGMGFNIATARLGNATTVITTRSEDNEFLKTEVDFARLQSTEKFLVPLNAIPKPKKGFSGTEIRVTLKRELSDYFSSERNLQIVRTALGDVYSYLLREKVPGLSRAGLSALIPAEIYVGGKRVIPKLPCIWSDQRSVQSYGQAVTAVYYADWTLTEATACLSCGYWDRSNGPTDCQECGGKNLQVRTRRIYGWLGIQRYIDASHYGIDFLRYGRKILKHDKSLFSYTDPDTLQVDIEYPIEMPANQGRIVGEIHLDHVPVTYQKNDFDRQSRDWQRAIEMIRGDGPLKPKSASNVNSSPLAALFSAYRRNDPGLRYLTPGDGTQALHSKAKEWGSYFEKGVPRYLEDSEWYEAAQRHQARKDNRSGDDESPKKPTDAPASPPESQFEKLIEVSPPAPSAEAPPPKRAKSRDEELAAARLQSIERNDLSGEFTLGQGLGSWTLEVRETSQPLRSPSGVLTPVVVSKMTGQSVELLVHRNHIVFAEYGRDVRDIAILQSAVAIKELTRKDIAIADIYAEIVQNIDDLRSTPVAVKEAITATFTRIKSLMLSEISDDPETHWNCLSVSEKQNLEEAAAGMYPSDRFQDVVDDGRFVTLLTGGALCSIIQNAPNRFFDNRVFRASLEHRPEPAKKRLIGKVVRVIESLSGYLDDPLASNSEDLPLAKTQLDSLVRLCKSDETI